MNFDPTSLVLSMIFGAFGVGYFIYGKKQGQFMPMLTGFLLSVFTIFVSDLWLQLFVGIGLLVLPWIMRF